MNKKRVFRKIGLFVTIACLSVITAGEKWSLTNKAQAQESLPGQCPDGYHQADAYTGIRNGQYFTICPNPSLATDNCCLQNS